MTRLTFEQKRELRREHKSSRGMFQLAVKRGRIIKPQNCSNCGIIPEFTWQLEGHHKDYDEPFIVEWLCVPCHRKADVRDGTTRLKLKYE